MTDFKEIITVIELIKQEIVWRERACEADQDRVREIKIEISEITNHDSY